MKARINNKAGSKLGNAGLNSPCTISEAVQIARGVSEDVVENYQNRNSHLQVAISLQIEIIKEMLFEKGIIDEKDFKERYIQKAEEFNEMQKAAMESAEEEVVSVDTKIAPSVDEIEVKKS